MGKATQQNRRVPSWVMIKTKACGCIASKAAQLEAQHSQGVSNG